MYIYTICFIQYYIYIYSFNRIQYPDTCYGIVTLKSVYLQTGSASITSCIKPSVGHITNNILAFQDLFFFGSDNIFRLIVAVFKSWNIELNVLSFLEMSFYFLKYFDRRVQCTVYNKSIKCYIVIASFG